ncbi:MAG: cysteine dioxygenase family protein [Candidatus Acidiferrales bacterium]
MSQLMSIDEWVKKLAAIPEREFTIPRVESFVQEHHASAESLEPYLFYARSHYTRNLIYKCDLFEIIAICWESGQVSRIHNHRDQNCWMAVPVGKLRVQNFRVEQQNKQSGTCRLVPSNFYDMDADHPGVVQPEEPVHQVLNLPEFGGRAATLHIYSRPYSSCEIYSLDKGVYSDVPLHYSSEYGKLSPDEKLL